jgi:hypothetical protein
VLAKHVHDLGFDPQHLKKLKIKPLYYLLVPLLGIYLEHLKSGDISIPVLFAALCTITKTWKQSAHGQMNKEEVTNIHRRNPAISKGQTMSISC